MKEGGRAHAQAVPRRREAFDRGSHFTLGSIAAWLRWLLRYRRGGNRPITCRLLICSTQTAAVLPPMRKTRVWTLWLILSLPVYPTSDPRSTIRSPLDSCCDIRSFPWPSSPTLFVLLFDSSLRSFAISSDPPHLRPLLSHFASTTHCLPASRTKHFLIGFRSERTSIRLCFGGIRLDRRNGFCRYRSLCASVVVSCPSSLSRSLLTIIYFPRFFERIPSPLPKFQIYVFTRVLAYFCKYRTRMP